jgi:hypothetical protein
MGKFAPAHTSSPRIHQPCIESRYGQEQDGSVFLVSARKDSWSHANFPAARTRLAKEDVRKHSGSQLFEKEPRSTAP